MIKFSDPFIDLTFSSSCQVTIHLFNGCFYTSPSNELPCGLWKYGIQELFLIKKLPRATGELFGQFFYFYLPGR
jgi:hypothetical protein